MVHALLISTFVIATCGLVYELIAGTVASYLLGDSVTQFSTIIGAYLFSMGVGSWIAKYVRKRLIAQFVQIEILVGLLGGTSAAVLFVTFGEFGGFRVILYSWVCLIGVLVGMEIPLLLRILKDQLNFSDLVSRVLSIDYLGALAASLLFPLWLVPQVGLVRSSFLFGIANVAIALWACRLFRSHLGPTNHLSVQAVAALIVLVAGFAWSDDITDAAETHLYTDEIIYAKSTPYQRIVLTRERDDVRLYLNGHLQFSSFDEYRYHETLVHPGLAASPDPSRVLVLGGGDGLAVRELLRDPRVKSITLVDLDGDMTRLFREHPAISQLNGGALRDPRVTIVNDDAFQWLQHHPGEFDFAVVDFPDPSNFSVGKLYTTSFYRHLMARLSPDGMAAIQSTSPLFARQSFWCIASTVKSVGLNVTPYHVYVPSFGEWGFVIGSRKPFSIPERFPAGLRFLTPATALTLFEFPADMAAVPMGVNRLDNQILVHTYDAEWQKLTP